MPQWRVRRTGGFATDFTREHRCCSQTPSTGAAAVRCAGSGSYRRTVCVTPTRAHLSAMCSEIWAPRRRRSKTISA